MSFVHYRSPDPRPGHLGESLRTRRVTEAWARIRRFLAECTDDPAPRSATLRVDAAVDADPSALVAETARSLGASTDCSSGQERGWEWSLDPARVETIVELCAQHEARPRIHVNAAVRRHGSPQTPQVWATIAYEIAVRSTVADTHAYEPGWGQSQLRAYLGYNEVWLVLHLPPGSQLEPTIVTMEQALGHTLARARFKLR